jgi:hypothetical protein
MQHAGPCNQGYGAERSRFKGLKSVSGHFKTPRLAEVGIKSGKAAASEEGFLDPGMATKAQRSRHDIATVQGDCAGKVVYLNNNKAMTPEAPGELYGNRIACANGEQRDFRSRLPAWPAAVAAVNEISLSFVYPQPRS